MSTLLIGAFQYRASCLNEFEDRLISKDQVIASHINDLTEDLVSHTICVKDALNAFIEVERVIYFSQLPLGIDKLSRLGFLQSATPNNVCRITSRTYQPW